MKYYVPHREDQEGSYHQQLLHGHKLKATPARIALLRLLERESSPLSIGDMESKMRPKYGLSVIYRNINSLVKTEIIKRINFGQAHARYELDHGRKHHHHVTCIKCGDMEDVTSCAIQKVQSHVAHGTEKFESVYEHSLEFRGLCKKCV